MTPINKCCKNIEQEHRLKYIRAQRRKEKYIIWKKKIEYEKGVKKLKNSVQQKK
jgi:hypothetical protein